MNIEVISSKVFVPTPGSGVGVMGGSYYTTAAGLELVSVHSHTSRSDTVEVAYLRRSEDNGRSWSEAEEWSMRFEDSGGMGRRHVRGGYVDPPTGRYIQVWTEGVLPTDDPLEGMRQWKLHYAVSEDGGRTRTVEEQIICEGESFDAEHPLPGVTVGKNCVMIGDLGQVPLTRSDGTILMPVQSTPIGPDGEYYNPGAGYTYTDCLLLVGRWAEDGRLSWSCSERVCGDPERTSRGLVEPTIAELADGGQTWGGVEPWTYADGEAFFSPSACSQLIPYADGRLLWAGNISAANPLGNRPRYPLVVGEVDRASGLLICESVQAVDDRQADDDEMLALSNFYARDDRETGELLLYYPRLFARGYEAQERWTTDLSLTRVAISYPIFGREPIISYVGHVLVANQKNG